MENEDDSSPASAPVPAAPVFDPRRRIRELLAIAERDRTDAEWDELNELEIQTAPGNRSSSGAGAGGQPYAYPAKPGGGQPQKNRPRGKGQRKPGMGRPPMQAKPNNKPRPPG
jgi:hypothetical protein